MNRIIKKNKDLILSFPNRDEEKKRDFFEASSKFVAEEAMKAGVPNKWPWVSETLVLDSKPESDILDDACLSNKINFFMYNEVTINKDKASRAAEVLDTEMPECKFDVSEIIRDPDDMSKNRIVLVKTLERDEKNKDAKVKKCYHFKLPELENYNSNDDMLTWISYIKEKIGYRDE